MVIFGPWDSETPEPIHLKSGMSLVWLRPRSDPHAKYGGRWKWGVGCGVGIWV